MCTNLTVFNYVVCRAEQLSPRRLTLEEMEARDLEDAKIGEASYKELVPKVRLIVQQLKAFSGCEFYVSFGSHPHRGIATVGGDIVLDYSMLNKPVIDIAQTLAHEWGHLALGHVANPHWIKPIEIDPERAEQEADFYSGVFLAAAKANYKLDDILNLKLELPDGAHPHGLRVGRAYYIACGYHHGVERKEMGLEGAPGVHVFGRSALVVGMPEDVDNKLRN
ncbi:MAG: hypothetical protein ACHQAX_01790 [Gammaproteobacteria bacterium]